MAASVSTTPSESFDLDGRPTTGHSELGVILEGAFGGADYRPLQKGEVVDKAFAIEAQVGSGGMGAVYRAVDTRLSRRVALKVPNVRWYTQGSRGQALFQREASATANLKHPNIVTIHQFGTWREQPYLVLEWLDGQTLADRLRDGALTWKEVAPLAHQLLDALQHAHDADVVHRDLKPSNVYLEPDGTLRVLDFGLAMFDRAPVVNLGDAKARVGTVPWMSPEQRAGEAQDHRTDIWAAGAVVFEMLTGRVLSDVGAQPLEQLPRDVPRHVRRALAIALAEDPGDRYDSAAEFASALAAQRNVRRWIPAVLVGALVVTIATLAATPLFVDSPAPVAKKRAFAAVVTTPAATPSAVERGPVRIHGAEVGGLVVDGVSERVAVLAGREIAVGLALRVRRARAQSKVSPPSRPARLPAEPVAQPNLPPILVVD